MLEFVSQRLCKQPLNTVIGRPPESVPVSITQSVRGNYKLFYGDKSDGCGRNASVYHVYPVSPTTGEGGQNVRTGEGGGGIPSASGRIYVKTGFKVSAHRLTSPC